MGFGSFSLKSSFARLSVVTLTLIGSAGLAAPVSAAGLLDAIFGRRAPQPTSWQTAPVFRDITVPVAGKRKTKSTVKRAAKPVSKFTVVKPANSFGLGHATGFRTVAVASVRPRVLPGPLGPFLLDTTLYRGDITVTETGLRVFVGGYSVRHSPTDFLPLSKAGNYHPGRQAMLAAIEQNNMRGAPQITTRQVTLATAPVPGFSVLETSTRQALLRPVSISRAPALQ